MEYKQIWWKILNVTLLTVVLQSCSSEKGDDELNRTGMLRLIVSEDDFGNDGNVSERRIYNYNLDGIVASLDFVDIDDGSIDQQFRFVNNEDGRVAEVLVDLGGDGSDEGTTIIRYDEAGRELSTTSTNIFNDLIQVKTNVYDNEGQLIESRFELNGEIESIVTVIQNEYDDFGRLIIRLIDSDMDNIADRMSTYEYGPMGELISTKIDNDNDGKIDISKAYTYEIGLCDRIQFGFEWGTVCR